MPESFPTPMEEPRKVMRALFLGAVQVDRPCGIDVIHGAIDQVSLKLISERLTKWRTRG